MWAEQTDVVNLDRMGKDDSPLFPPLLSLPFPSTSLLFRFPFHFPFFFFPLFD